MTPCLVFEAVRGLEAERCAFRCVAWNPAAEAAVRAHGAGGDMARWVERVRELLDPAECARVVGTGEPYLGELHCRLEGVESWWQFTAVPRGEGFALWLRDVTAPRCEERKAREALAQALAREERMEEEAGFRERFIGILGHDLRNPLSAILMAMRALPRYGPLSPMQEDLGRRIESSAARMARMITDILDLTRARRSGGIPLVLVPTRLNTVCQQVVGELAAAHPDRCILYSEQGRGDGVWDGERLAQVLSNLVSNALEHGGEEVPVIVRSYAQGDMQALEVHNPGPPIPADRLETLFDPFQRASPAFERGRRRRQGLGLGLYIVKEIVQAHGGRVVVRSVEREGTTFTVLLPRDARSAVAEQLSREAALEPGARG